MIHAIFGLLILTDAINVRGMAGKQVTLIDFYVRYIKKKPRINNFIGKKVIGNTV